MWNKNILIDNSAWVTLADCIKYHLLSPECRELSIIATRFCANSVNYIKIKEPKVSEYYLLALLNSSVLNFYFSKISTNSNVNGYEVDALSIVIPTSKQDKQVSDLVKKVLAVKSADPETDTSVLETQIDNLVNHLYGIATGVK